MSGTGNAIPLHLAAQRGDPVLFRNSALPERLSRILQQVDERLPDLSGVDQGDRNIGCGLQVDRDAVL